MKAFIVLEIDYFCYKQVSLRGVFPSLSKAKQWCDKKVAAKELAKLPLQVAYIVGMDGDTLIATWFMKESKKWEKLKGEEKT